MECYDEFLKLDQEHSDEQREFSDGVHIVQNILMKRIVRRVYPKGWPMYKNEPDTDLEESPFSKETTQLFKETQEKFKSMKNKYSV